MENLRERKVKSENGAPAPDQKLPSVHLQRQENMSLKLKTFLLRNYFLIGCFIISILFVYSYLSMYSINKIFFKYGHPLGKAWKQNDLLAKAEFIDIKMRGPEAITFGPDGSLYTGLSNGVIIRVDTKGRVEKIVQIGDEMDERVCDNVKRGHIAEPPCGRPFGLRMKPNTNYLYVADSFYGIIKIDVINKTKQIILHSNDTRFGDKPLRSTEDLDIDGDDIYFVDSSYKHDLNEMIQDVIYAFPGGRLFRYNEKNDELELVVDRLYYPNGVQLTPTKDALLINEFSMARIMKFYLKGPKKGQTELFTEIPGLSDAIRLTHHNTLLVPFVAVFPTGISLTGFMGKWPFFRSLVGYFLNPNNIMNIWPRYGLVAEYDLNGNILKTWHDKTAKKVGLVTNAVLHNNKLYLGSYSEHLIAVVDYK